MRRILLSVLAIILMMGMTGCSSSTNENSSQQTEEQTTENNTSVDFEKDYGIKNEDMQELFDSIKSDILAYDSSFEWPDGGKSCWGILNAYLEFCTMDKSKEEFLKLSEEQLEKIITSDSQKSIQQIGLSLIEWLDKHPEYRNGETQDIHWYEILPENIDLKK